MLRRPKFFPPDMLCCCRKRGKPVELPHYPDANYCSISSQENTMWDNAQPKTILLVEDEALIAMQEARQLQKESYVVVTACSGEEAIATVQAAAPPIDLILMDIDLGQGKMDGTLADQAVLQTHDIPIV